MLNMDHLESLDIYFIINDLLIIIYELPNIDINKYLPDPKHDTIFTN